MFGFFDENLFINLEPRILENTSFVPVEGKGSGYWIIFAFMAPIAAAVIGYIHYFVITSKRASAIEMELVKSLNAMENVSRLANVKDVLNKQEGEVKKKKAFDLTPINVVQEKLAEKRRLKVPKSGPLANDLV